jgi:hypothetical protein
MPGPIPGRGGRRVEQTGGKIMSAHVYCNEKSDGVDYSQV